VNSNKYNSNLIAIIQMLRLCLPKMFKHISDKFIDNGITEEDPDLLTEYLISIINDLNSIVYVNSRNKTNQISNSFNKLKKILNGQYKKITDVNELIATMITHFGSLNLLDAHKMLHITSHSDNGLGETMPPNLQPSYLIVPTTVKSSFNDSITINRKNYHLTGFIFMDTYHHYSLAVKAGDIYVIFNDDEVSRCIDRNAIECMYELACTLIYEQ